MRRIAWILLGGGVGLLVSQIVSFPTSVFASILLAVVVALPLSALLRWRHRRRQAVSRRLQRWVPLPRRDGSWTGTWMPVARPSSQNISWRLWSRASRAGRPEP